MTNLPDPDAPQPQQPAAPASAQPPQPAPPASGQQPPPAYPQASAYGQPPAYGQAPAYPQSADGGYGVPATPQNPGKVLGIVAFVLAFFVQLVGLILGIVALVQSKKAGQKNGFAVWAIILSAVFMVLGIIAAIIGLVVFASFTADITQNCGPGGSGFVTVWGQQVSCSNYSS
ncbi:hypothetical protein GCM10022240_09840 [Microbacterium kribbense]|uniref:DUF4190 domain-containing protein n=1 Tax=Microbacterium kribbense TaxID=433645 RepID=A0ABP7G8P7_9MICO